MNDPLQNNQPEFDSHHQQPESDSFAQDVMNQGGIDHENHPQQPEPIPTADSSEPGQLSDYDQSFTEAKPGKNLKMLILGGLVIILALGGLLLFSNSGIDQATIDERLENDMAVEDMIILDDDATTEPLPPLPEEMTDSVPVETTISLQTQTAELNTGDTFNISVIADSDQEVDGVEFVITYDPTMLGSVSLSRGTIFNTYIREEVMSEDGRISVGMIANPGQEIVLTEGSILATITGTAIRPGELILSFDQNRTIVAAGGGQNILQNTRGLSILIN